MDKKPYKVIKNIPEKNVVIMEDRGDSDLTNQIKYWKKRAQEAEGETTIVKGIGMNSPEFLALKKRVKELENSLSIALKINDDYQREVRELRDDNKKLAKQVEDKADFVGKLRGKGLI